MARLPKIARGLEDRQAFVARYEGPLKAYFSKRLSSSDEVEDLVQDVFRRIWSSNSSARIKNPDGYIFQTAANLLRERYRKDGTREAAMAQLPFFSPEHEEITPERILQDRQTLRLLEKTLLEMPSRTRTVFLLHRFEGFKYREIADRLGVSVSSVEKHIASATRQLAVRMDREE